MGSDNIVASPRPTNLKKECSLNDLQQMLSSFFNAHTCMQMHSQKHT